MRALLLVFCLLTATLSAANRPPNLIFVLADDLGYGELGCFGSKFISTPNLDRMAAEGMKFTRFYAGSTVCAPSRSVLMTGLHTGHTRVRGNAGKDHRDAQSLRAGDTTLARVLHDAGYRTALIGKWGLGAEGGEGQPIRQGFDYFYGYLDQVHAHNPYPEFIIRNDSRIPLRNRTIPGTGQNGGGIAEQPLDFVPDLMTAEALEWVEQEKERPFFLYWSLIAPHANNEGTKHGRGQEVPDLGPYADRDWPTPDKGHAAVISRLDADLGRLFALLKKLGLERDTLVLFSSDNGPHKEGGNDPERFDANGPLTGLKRSLTDGGIRVPTLAWWPGRIPAGSVNGDAYWFADILPSLARLAGVKQLPEKLDGEPSLALLFRGARIAHVTRPVLYWEFHEAGFSQAVLMDERWKAIRLRRLDAPIALYDTQTDVAEQHDLAAQHPELVERARSLFTSERQDSPDWPIPR